MKRVMIFRYIRSPKDNKVLGKLVLRIISVHESFIGIGEKGNINRAEFQRFADDLEPSNEGFSIS